MDDTVEHQLDPTQPRSLVQPANVVFEAPMSLIDVTAYATGYNVTLVSTDRTSPP